MRARLSCSQRSVTAVAWCLALALVVAAPGRASADSLTLDATIERALTVHERAQIADLRVEAAEGELYSARSEFLPSLTLGAQATLQDDDEGRYITGGGTLTLRQPILAPSAIPRLWSAEHTLNAEKLTADQEKRVLSFETARAFLQALAADQFVHAAEARLKRAKANMDNAQARVDAELNSSNDVTRAKLEVAGAAREVAQRKREVASTRLELGVLLGEEVTGDLVSPDTMFADARAFVGDPAALSASAAGARPDVLALEEQTLATREAAKEPLFRIIPSIDLTGQLRVNPDPIADAPWHEESLTLSLTWTIFDGGGRYGDHRVLAARAKTAELQQSLATRSVSNEVRIALAGLEAAKETFTVAEAAAAAAQTNVEETNILYTQGLARAIELVDANAEQFDADVELAAARIELIRSYLELRFALGLYPTGGATK